MADGMAVTQTHTTIRRADGVHVVLLERAGHVCGCCGMWMQTHACHVDGQAPPADVVSRLRQTAAAYAVDPGASRLVALLNEAAQLLGDRI